MYQSQSGISEWVLQMPDAVEIGTVENILIFNSVVDTGVEAYALYLNNQYVAWLVGEWGKGPDGKSLYILRTYVLPSYRNKGLMTALHKALSTKFNITLVSDEYLSPESVKIWNSLHKHMTVQAFNLQTGEVKSLDDVPHKDLYTNKIWRFVLCKTVYMEGFSLPSVGRHFLADYIHFTHPDNIGMFK